MRQAQSTEAGRGGARYRGRAQHGQGLSSPQYTPPWPQLLALKGPGHEAGRGARTGALTDGETCPGRGGAGVVSPEYYTTDLGCG